MKTVVAFIGLGMSLAVFSHNAQGLDVRCWLMAAACLVLTAAAVIGIIHIGNK